MTSGGIRGAVLIPAHQEGEVIARTLLPLSSLVDQRVIQVVVAANGCSDDTVEQASRVAGVTVIDLPTGGKAGALNAADAIVEVHPRIYLDADVEITRAAVLDLLSALSDDTLLAARPPFAYVTDSSSWPVRSYYRARARIPSMNEHLWGAGVYALSRRGHERLGTFPDLIADDLWIDGLFSEQEKAVIETQPVRIHCPRTSRSLLGVLRRVYRGNRQAQAPGQESQSAVAVLWTVHDVGSLIDAVVYSAFALLGRRSGPVPHSGWERDDSSRSRSDLPVTG